MREHPLMKCGHIANAKHNGKPSCVICAGIVEGALEIAEEQPSFEGRMSKCASCGKLTPTNSNLAFLEYRPTKECDLHYCGCRGWD
jgi:hypothetical protein